MTGEPRRTEQTRCANQRRFKNERTHRDAGPTARDDADVAVGVLRLLALTMVRVVEVCNGLSQRFDTSSRTVLSASERHVNRLGSLEAALDVVVDFRSALTKIGP